MILLGSGAALIHTRVEQDKEAALVASLARRFTALVRGCGVGQAEHPVAPLADLDAWLAEARACGVGTVETFAAGLEQDGAAVRAALTLPWSNGQAEARSTGSSCSNGKATAGPASTCYAGAF